MILPVDNPSTYSVDTELESSLVIPDCGFGSPRHEVDYWLLSKDNQLTI